jgi:hypothetical protein
VSDELSIHSDTIDVSTIKDFDISLRHCRYVTNLVEDITNLNLIGACRKGMTFGIGWLGRINLLLHVVPLVFGNVGSGDSGNSYVVAPAPTLWAYSD